MMCSTPCQSCQTAKQHNLRRLHVACARLQGTGGPGSGAAPQSALQGISGIKVDPKDFEETTKR